MELWEIISKMKFWKSKKLETTWERKRGELFERRGTSENKEDREMRSSGKVTWFFLSFCHYHYLLSFLPAIWATFVDFAILGHYELCWFWLDHMYFVVDTSSVLFGVVRLRLRSQFSNKFQNSSFLSNNFNSTPVFKYIFF